MVGCTLTAIAPGKFEFPIQFHSFVGLCLQCLEARLRASVGSRTYHRLAMVHSTLKPSPSIVLQSPKRHPQNAQGALLLRLACVLPIAANSNELLSLLLFLYAVLQLCSCMKISFTTKTEDEWVFVCLCSKSSRWMETAVCVQMNMLYILTSHLIHNIQSVLCYFLE